MLYSGLTGRKTVFHAVEATEVEADNNRFKQSLCGRRVRTATINFDPNMATSCSKCRAVMLEHFEFKGFEESEATA